MVPPEEAASGFYSRYFLVPKKDGNYRPISPRCDSKAYACSTIWTIGFFVLAQGQQRYKTAI